MSKITRTSKLRQKKTPAKQRENSTRRLNPREKASSETTSVPSEKKNITKLGKITSLKKSKTRKKVVGDQKENSHFETQQNAPLLALLKHDTSPDLSSGNLGNESAKSGSGFSRDTNNENYDADSKDATTGFTQMPAELTKNKIPYLSINEREDALKRSDSCPVHMKIFKTSIDVVRSASSGSLDSSRKLKQSSDSVGRKNDNSSKEVDGKFVVLFLSCLC